MASLNIYDEMVYLGAEEKARRKYVVNHMALLRGMKWYTAEEKAFFGDAVNVLGSAEEQWNALKWEEKKALIQAEMP